MQLLFNVFYKQYGIRRVQQLVSPRLFPIESFLFPRNASYHFVSHDEVTIAPDPSQHFLSIYTKRIMMDVLADMTEHKGNAKKVNSPILKLIRPWFAKNHLFKYMKEPTKTIHDPTTLTVFDYACLQKLYRYTQQPLTPYYKWFNIEKTVWDSILKLTEESERQNFVFMELPDVLPSYTSLRMYTQRLNNSMLHIFDSPAKHFILELWRWISEEARETSLLGQFKQENLDKVNLVFVFKGKWCVLNLGQFNQWRKHPEPKPDGEATEKGANTISYAPVQLQKLLLKFFISIQSQIAPVEEPLEDVEGIDAKKDETSSDGNPPEVNDEDDTETDPDDEADDDTPIVTKTPEIEPKPLPPAEPPVEDDAFADLSEGELNDDTFKDIDKDLQTLDYIENKTMMLKGVQKNVTAVDITPAAKAPVTFTATPDELETLHDTIFTDSQPDEALLGYIDKHVDYGLMSAADYRATVKQANKFMESASPYGQNQSTRDFIKISQEDLKIKPSDIQMADIKTVPDKSMLESSLMTFDSKYIKHVMPKDVTSMVAHIQKAGIIVQEYNVEKENSALGEYEMHTLKIKPVDGAVSTLHFKLPSVDEEGNLVANGNKYHMRKQRSD